MPITETFMPRGYGKGRAIAWTSDIGPHWCPPDFVSWEGYGRLWQQCLSWLTGAESVSV